MLNLRWSVCQRKQWTGALLMAAMLMMATVAKADLWAANPQMTGDITGTIGGQAFVSVGIGDTKHLNVAVGAQISLNMSMSDEDTNQTTGTKATNPMFGYLWTLPGNRTDGQQSVTYQAPNAAGAYTVTCKVTDSGAKMLVGDDANTDRSDASITRTLIIHVIDGRLYHADPEITIVNPPPADAVYTVVGGNEQTFTIGGASDEDGYSTDNGLNWTGKDPDAVQYAWTCTKPELGQFVTATNGATVTWKANTAPQIQVAAMRGAMSQEPRISHSALPTATLQRPSPPPPRDPPLHHDRPLRLCRHVR